MAKRLSINKTPKCYVGGAFIRSESGRTTPLHDADGAFLAHIPQCSRKDFRNAVESAAKAGASWCKRTGYNRGQIFYRLAEMLESRGGEMAAAIARDGTRQADAEEEVATTVDRIVYYAGWADKYEQLLATVNPVSAPYFCFTVTDASGVIAILAPGQSPLLGLMSLVLPAITSGNSVVALASEARPYPAILLGEMLATSDLPGGVVNVLTGLRAELVPTLATHAHVRAVSGVADAKERELIRNGAADSVKRTFLIAAEEAVDWTAQSVQSLQAIANLVEYKTTWHPIGS